MRTKHILAVALATTTLSAARAEVVYSNTNSYTANFGSIGTTEVGDEIILGGTGRLLTDFSFQVYSVSLSGNESVRLRLLYNDGGTYTGNPSYSGYQLPSGVLWDSGFFGVDLTVDGNHTIQYHVSDSSLPNNLWLPDSFTFAITFSGVTGGETVGVGLFSPPTVGASARDYWYHDPSTGWEPRTNEVQILNFGAQVTAVPEPSVWSLSILGGLAGLFLLRRRASNS